MWFPILVVVFGAAWAVDLPSPHITYLDNGAMEISIDGAGLDKVKSITYQLVGDKKHTGPFHKTVDGQWVHRNINGQKYQGKDILYALTVVKDGKQETKMDVLKPDIATSLVVMPPVTRVQRGTVVFRDDFSGTSLNKNDWKYEVSMYGGYNWEIQVYTNDNRNVFVRDGNLYLKPTLTSDKFDEAYLTTGKMDMHAIWGECTNADRYGCYREGKNGLLPPVMSGKIKTVGHHNIKYGSVEVRAKIPRGDWIWPAIWMLPEASVYGAWPRSGEIDMMESRGNTRAVGGSNHGVNQVSSTLHWGSDAGHNRYSQTTGHKEDGSYWSSAFHTYRLDWTSTHLITYVDNVEIMNVPVPPEGFWNRGHFPGSDIWGGHKSAPFDQAFYLILNVAIGGTNGFFPDGWSYDTHKPWTNGSPTEDADFWNHRNDWLPTWHGDDVAMQVDYVQMTQY